MYPVSWFLNVTFLMVPAISVAFVSAIAVRCAFVSVYHSLGQLCGHREKRILLREKSFGKSMTRPRASGAERKKAKYRREGRILVHLLMAHFG